LLAVFELGRSERVAGHDARRGEVVQDHVHAGETGGGHIHLLALERDALAGRNAGVGVAGESAHVQLVDHRLVVWPTQRTVYDC